MMNVDEVVDYIIENHDSPTLARDLMCSTIYNQNTWSMIQTLVVAKLIKTKAKAEGEK